MFLQNCYVKGMYEKKYLQINYNNNNNMSERSGIIEQKYTEQSPEKNYKL